MTEKQLRQKIVDCTTSYIGTKEGDAKHKEIVDIFNNSKLCKRYKMTYKDAWCATFASSIFIKCDMATIFPCVECSCGKMIDLAKTATPSIWEEKDDILPEIGDLILYDWDDGSNYATNDNKNNPDHVGIVTKVNTKTFIVTEGNYSNSVKNRTMNVNGRYIRGFIKPNYKALASEEEKKEETPKTTPEQATNSPTYKVDYAAYFNKALAGEYRVNASDGLNIRVGAGTSKTKITALGNKVKVNCYGYYSKAQGQNWLLIKMQDGRTGFACADYLKKVN